MGEQPSSIFISGAPGIEQINKNLNDRKYLEKNINFLSEKKIYFLHFILRP